MKKQYDVAVVGGGFAGTVAARDLSKEGISVVLLEGRNRIGGRTYTGEAFGTQLDLGGTYVHWTQPNVWHELQRHNLTRLVPPLDQGEKVFWLAEDKVHSGTQADFLSAVGPAMARLVGDARARFPMPFDIHAVPNSEIRTETIEDRMNSLNLTSYERDVLEGALAGVCHSFSKHGMEQLLWTVAAYFGEYMAFFETAGTFAIQGGTKALVDAIMAESSADVLLSTPVSAIADDGSQVTVTTRGGQQISARSVVVAVPINTIADIKITPEVPAPVRTMIEQRNPTLANKLWVRVKGEIEPFGIFAPIGKNPINAARTEVRHEGDTLIMCICSDAAAIDYNDLDAVQAALRVFVPDIEVVGTACHDWVADEFSQGGWMMHRPGNLTGAAPQMRQAHGRIYFAGADIAAIDVGAIEGAMETGAVAAREITAAFSGKKR
ncbi:uncharacterized protein Z520_05938 [Fonsecaea multimorphosa CBS 102226]|uniref:Amine oxidase n=1 Tax=Fonsecaea multimorphosa CBS 102226 TaxID=1442371 RepID=A0A0D2JYM0_9EURO|nr:uncharacterized protein Z520_05938 [Fonsecaea multimorphosa CBS 102226]KIX98637.1 hypothetical protein Z520_05938 [Fonsecaea multimorphosa CBS 102226]OAL24826.1 hypothetical protein AYO22_05615 [Fonsecaea multimorphosa]